MQLFLSKLVSELSILLVQTLSCLHCSFYSNCPCCGYWPLIASIAVTLALNVSSVFLQRKCSFKVTIHNSCSPWATALSLISMSIKPLHSNNGREYVNQSFSKFRKENGIAQNSHVLIVDTHKYNGIGKRKKSSLEILELYFSRCVLLIHIQGKLI